jgi:hypothetical protein
VTYPCQASVQLASVVALRPHGCHNRENVDAPGSECEKTDTNQFD